MHDISRVYSLSLLFPWRSSARATVMRVVKQDRTSRTEITPLGNFCQKAQLVSQPAFFSVARCRPGFYAATTGGEENQGIQVAKVYIRFSKL